MIVYLLAFVFPAAAFFGGAYLVFRGISKPAPTLKFTSGTARAETPLRRHLDGEEVVYSKMTIEYFTGRSPEWKAVYSSERKAPFRLSGRPVSVEHADIRLSQPEILQGMVQGGPDLMAAMGNLVGYTGRKAGIRAPWRGQPGPFIDPRVIDILNEDAKLKKILERHRREFIRISVFSAAQGGRLCVASTGKALEGTMEHPILITDGKEENARSTVDEKARLSVLLGAGLVAFSFILCSVLISSL